jgi:hypothetical protein
MCGDERNATMQNQFSSAAKTIWQLVYRRRNIAIGLTIALTLTTLTASDSAADELNRQGKYKIAEMTALVRHSEPCPQVPRKWSVAYLMLLMMAPPVEEQVVELEHKMLALRAKIGTAKWCLLYSVEMEEAYLIIKQTMQR